MSRLGHILSQRLWAHPRVHRKKIKSPEGAKELHCAGSTSCFVTSLGENIGSSALSCVES
jgi:hypothetical protein